jgi:hypothetical protein
VIQATSKEDVENAIDELLTNINVNVTNSERNSYLKKMRRINDKVRVENVIKTIQLEYLDGEHETTVLVKKI